MDNKTWFHELPGSIQREFIAILGKVYRSELRLLRRELSGVRPLTKREYAKVADLFHSRSFNQAKHILQRRFGVLAGAPSEIDWANVPVRPVEGFSGK